MCGVAGALALAPEARVDVAGLERVAERLAHRGPDDSGLWVAPDRRAALAFRRLAIIDVAGGHQPMLSADGAVAVVMNGEIYEHKALRRELEARGCRFRTRADTEVLVHGYRAFGDALPERLHGMFAFCAVDLAAGTALLARDRMGKRPLLTVEHGGVLYFASELAALLALPGLPREIDPAAVDVFLGQQFIPPPRSIYRGIEKLPPAGRLRLRPGGGPGGLVRDRYWSACFAPKLAGTPRDLAAELRRLLTRAVERRLESEVPLGAFLSGGVDSGAVVALAARALGRLSTYTIGFEDGAGGGSGDAYAGFDEREPARALARMYGTDHREWVVRCDVEADLERILARYGEPFGDKSAVPSWYVAREARRDLTVVLTGDGGDDLFAGYGRYAIGALARRAAGAAGMGRLAWAERALLEHLVAPRPGGGLARALAGWARRSALPVLRSLALPGFFDGPHKQALYRPEFLERLAGGGLAELARAEHARTLGLPSAIDRLLAVDLEQYLAGDLLPKVDIASMAHALEARSPLLDQDVVDFALRLPDELRVQRGHGKWLLRQAVADLLPPGHAWRSKHGFSAPVNAWLAGPLLPLARRLLLDEARGIGEFARPERVRRLLDEHASGRRRHGGRLWLLLAYEIWWREVHSR